MPGWFIYKPHKSSFLYFHHAEQEMFPHNRERRMQEIRNKEPRRAFCLDISETWDYFAENSVSSYIVKWND